MGLSPSPGWLKASPAGCLWAAAPGLPVHQPPSSPSLPEPRQGGPRTPAARALQPRQEAAYSGTEGKARPRGCRGAFPALGRTPAQPWGTGPPLRLSCPEASVGPGRGTSIHRPCDAPGCAWLGLRWSNLGASPCCLIARGWKHGKHDSPALLHGSPGRPPHAWVPAVCSPALSLPAGCPGSAVAAGKRVAAPGLPGLRCVTGAAGPSAAARPSTEARCKAHLPHRDELDR